MKCVFCRKPITDQSYRKVESVISGQGTHRNFRPQSFFWHETCWQEEKVMVDRHNAEMTAERDKEIAFAVGG